MLLLYAIVFLSVPFVIKTLKDSFVKFYQTHSIDIALKDFIEEYNKYQGVLDMDCDAKEILTICKSQHSIIQIGVLEKLTFKNAIELRKCFLKAGEFIIQYTDYLQRKYGYIVDQVDYEYSLAILKLIRRICLQKGENCVVYVNYVKK